MTAFVEWPSLTTVGGFVALLSIYLAASTLYSWYRLRNVPGPLLAGFSYTWALKAIASGRQASIYEELTRQYGPLVRIGPELVLTDDIEVLRRMSATRSSYGKDNMYKASIRHPDHDSMFSTVDVTHHDQIKSKLAGSYGGRETLAMEPIVDKLLNTLVQHFRTKIASAEGSGNLPVVNLDIVVNYFTMDVITRIAFGRELGCLESDSDVHRALGTMSAALKRYTIPLSIPWLRDITTGRLFIKFFGPKPTDKTGLGVMMGLVQDSIKERYQPGAPDQKDLLGGFVRSGLVPGACMSEVLAAMVAGSDTTASAIRSTLLHLMTTPPAYRKLKEIVQQAVRDGAVSTPIMQEEAKKIPYIQALIYEGLRMRPPAPVVFGKVVPPEGDVIDGKFLPGGITVTGILLPAMRSTEFWGADAHIFRPDRFIEVDDKKRASMERLVEISFGYGRYRCAGQPLAFMELNKAFFELFRYFDFQLVNPYKPLNTDFFTVWRDTDFQVWVTEADPI